MTLERQKRFFHITEICESVYNCVRTLAPEPDLVEIRMAQKNLEPD